MEPATPSFYLTNSSNKPPIVHSNFVSSTGTWQYVVADPSTKHCLIIDAVRDRRVDKATDEAAILTDAADAIVSLVRQNGYLVDYIVETQSSAIRHQSASWYLRMQFSDLQGWPPQLFSEGTVSAMENLWRRKYGATSTFLTKHRGALTDGECITVGRMRVRCMHVPSFSTPQRRAFVIGNNVFGAHSLATLSKDSQCATAPEDTLAEETPPDSDTYSEVWTSMQRILSLPEETRVYFDMEDASKPDSEQFDEIHQCRVLNQYLGLSAKEFAVRWDGENKARTQWREQAQASKTWRKSRKR